MSASVVRVDLSGVRVAAAPLIGSALGEALVQPTELSDATALIDQLVGMVEQAGIDDLEAVGIGLPRIVEFRTGRVVPSSRKPSPATNGALELPLAGVPLREALGERLGVPVFVDNDAN